MSPKRILVVDDEPMVCESVKMLLAADHHEAVVATDALEALTKFETSNFDLIFTDYLMPGIRGDQLAHAIKARDQKKPVVLLTAFPPRVEFTDFDLVMLKPLSLAHLRETLGKLFPSPA